MCVVGVDRGRVCVVGVGRGRMCVCWMCAEAVCVCVRACAEAMCVVGMSQAVCVWWAGAEAVCVCGGCGQRPCVCVVRVDRGSVCVWWVCRGCVCVCAHSKEPILAQFIKKNCLQGFLGGSVIKNPFAIAGDMGSIPDPGRCHMLQNN